MEGAGSASAGSGRPNTSQRIFVFSTVRLPLREVLLLPHDADIFTVSLLSFHSAGDRIRRQSDPLLLLLRSVRVGEVRMSMLNRTSIALGSG
jgi:hypothetical protein